MHNVRKRTKFHTIAPGEGGRINASRRTVKFTAILLRSGSLRQRVRCLIMTNSPHLSEPEWASLAEVGTGFCHAPIPADHARRLLDLKLIYSLLGSYRIMHSGREMLRGVH